MARILVVEDDPDIQKILAYNLGQSGHEVLASRSGREGLALARAHQPDLVLLDVMLPDLNGTQLCGALKADRSTAGIRVVMLTARGEETDRVAGFQLGVDDYVVKPFSVQELLLRIQAVLRRNAVDPRVEFGVLRIDREARRTWVAGGEIELTSLEFRLLCALQAHGNKVSTRSALLDQVWGMSADVTARTVDTHIQRLREKLGAAAQYIETVRGEGYRFAEAPARPRA